MIQLICPYLLYLSAIRIIALRRIFIFFDVLVILVVHQNRDFTFNGIVQTGNFALFGKQMDFVYDPFEIELNKIDSLQYSVPSGMVDKQGFPVDWTVKTVISDLVGKLYVDAPQNKSGLADKADYPKLHSYEDSYIYYDKIKKFVYAAFLILRCYNFCFTPP